MLQPSRLNNANHKPVAQLPPSASKGRSHLGPGPHSATVSPPLGSRFLNFPLRALADMGQEQTGTLHWLPREPSEGLDAARKQAGSSDRQVERLL